MSEVRYEINLEETVVEAKEYTLYRGRQVSDSAPVFVKSVENGGRGGLQLSHEYSILKELRLESVPEAMGLAGDSNGLALVMGDGQPSLSLESWLSRGPLAVGEFLELAAAMAGALGDVHRQKMIHKSITAQTVLVGLTVAGELNGKVYLTNFGHASRLASEREEVKAVGALEGDLRYLSPEQTGRMNRSVDWRSDLYSLGVVYYQMLSGRVPFDAGDAMEMVHAQIAHQPVPLHELDPKIPKVLSELVSKLLAKAGEERYQSGHGLQAELVACRQEWETTGALQVFEIGSMDISERFQISQKLYGREAEVEYLMTRFAEAAAGKAQLLLVGGFSGVGKSALISEVHKPIVERRGYFLSGKFDQFKRNIPLSAVSQAFTGMIKQILREPEESLQRWKKTLSQALGTNGQIMVELVSDLEKIIGQQPELARVGPQEAQNRFYYTVERFVRCLATPEHPLVLFLDDLQWADAATLELFKTLLNTAEHSSLLVIGAYRDNEVDASHPFIQTVEAVEKTGGTVNRLTLKPLGTEDLAKLISDTIKRTGEDILQLATAVHTKTQGNPFFIGEMLSALHRQGVIAFDRGSLSWRWEMSKVAQAEVSDNVVELMIRRLRGLAEATQYAVRLASCMGNVFELRMLALIAQRSESQIADALWPAVAEGLIAPIGDGYKFVHDVAVEDANQGEAKAKVSYRFGHDRVQQAAYGLIDESRRQAVHLKIAQLLVKQLPKDQLEDRVFDVVGHWSAAESLITEADRNTAVQIFLLAGEKAVAATARKAAIEYLETAERLAGFGVQTSPTDPAHIGHEISFKLLTPCSTDPPMAGTARLSHALHPWRGANRFRRYHLVALNGRNTKERGEQ